jgi:hypothetical protein
MACSMDIKTKCALATRLSAGLALSACLVLGPFVASGRAQQHVGNGHPREPSGRHGGRHDVGRGAYYRPPPVVYGSPYGNSRYGSPYYPPPVVYVPGISIGIW